MNQLFGKLLSLFGGGPGPILTPDQFTQEVATAFRKKRPQVALEIVKELEIKFGDHFTSFLNNAYDLYRHNPTAKKQIVGDVLATGLEVIDRSGQQVNRKRIVPVIKDNGWLEEGRKAMAERGRGEFPVPVHEAYNPELILCYAEDSARGIRYLQDKDLEEIGLAREELRELAIANLKELLTDVRCQGGEGLYMMTADGTYESSLILFEDLWTDGRLDLRGEIVVAIPARNLLFVTGTGNTEALARLQEVLAESEQEEMPYRLTSTLFVYRGGKFEIL
ncbi:DUF1444 family protein [Haloferula sp. BvORR071]|uniref:DUF1444 family protein n=1 Tax=Haloferula sp. BvORR071 TaxID=1396141 RepID=UPI000557CA81|nr:DUF1444 family protein [Haloferula sp. BvORR071]